MIRVDAGLSPAYCDGLSRRSFVQLGLSGLACLGVAETLRSSASAGNSNLNDRSVLLIWLDGGPSHLDLYDLKPEAPAEYRGFWRPIPTNVPGIEISELFPKQARVADKFSIVRSLHHGSGDHFTGGHYMLTSRGGASGANTAGRAPSIGSYIARIAGPNRPGMLPYVAVPYASSIGIRPGYFGGNYLGAQYNPFETEGDPNAANFEVKNINLAGGLSIEKLEDRRTLLTTLDRVQRSVDATGTFDAMDKFDRDAYSIVAGPAARKAFDLSTESPRLRDRYGRDNWGQSTLLARRLVEAGAKFVAVHYGGWDHHWDLKEGMTSYLPRVDAAVATLFADLDARGLLERTLVVLCGEFSRTPKMNDGSGRGTPGRDHWGNAMFCLMGGGGVNGGQIVGSTDRLGQNAKDRPVTPSHIHATIYRALGIDSATTFPDHTGRPMYLLDDRDAIDELLV